MIRIAILSAALTAAAIVPAFAEFHIIHGADRRCRVVERYEPGEREIVRVGPFNIATREEAERQLRVVCRDNGYYRGEERREERAEGRRDDRREGERREERRDDRREGERR